MPLKIKLGPNEAFYIGPARLRNCDRRSELLIETPGQRVLTERHVLQNPNVAMAYLSGDPDVTYADVRSLKRSDGEA